MRTNTLLAPFIEDDLPPAVLLPPPDRVEATHFLSLGVEHRPAAEGKAAGGEDLDHLGFPGERWVRVGKEAAPAGEDLLFTPQHGRITEEDRFGRYAGRERRQVPL